MAKKTKPETKMHKVMGEFKRGTLHIGRSKHLVKTRAQAIVIGLSESGLSKGKGRGRKRK